MLSVSIPLKEKALEQALHMQDILFNQGKVSHIQENGFPHITLLAGINNEKLELLKEALNFAVNLFKGIELKTKGIGLLALDTPLVYLRWEENKDLVQAKNQLMNCLLERDILKSGLAYNDDWIIKSTICFHDTRYNIELFQAIEQISKMHVKCNMKIDSISIISYGTCVKEQCLFEAFC